MLCPFWGSGIPFRPSLPVLPTPPAHGTPSCWKIPPPQGIFLQGYEHWDESRSHRDRWERAAKRGTKEGNSCMAPLLERLLCLPVSMEFLTLFTGSWLCTRAGILLLSATCSSGPSRMRKECSESQRQALEGQSRLSCTLAACPSISILGTEWKRSPVSCNYRGLWHNNSPARQLQTDPGLIHPEAISQPSLERGQPGSRSSS